MSAKGRPEREHRSAQREGTPTSATGRPEREGTPMTHLNIETNIAAPDDFYESLISLHRGLSDEQSALVNAKLILLLSNHVGDAEVLREAMAAAAEGVTPAALPAKSQ